ncbi:MAG: ABC transporter ATP-binding protein [Bacilli bacterium]|nr:ABC transporter ATP-binding protein [Bacilli bacterium]
MKKIILSTNKLSKSFSSGGRQQHVLKNLDIELFEGDFTVIMGASGAGKSTLLYALSGMDKPTIGCVKFLNEEISSLSEDKLAIFRRKNCGFIFQQIYLMDNMSVLDNILISGFLVNKDRIRVANKAKELLLEVGLEESIWGKFPSQLSGGEAQRAAIVRSLINDPAILFADEPTGSLNSSSGTAALDILTKFNDNGQSIIMVTHDLKSARRGNRILYLRDGVVCGTCDLGKYLGDEVERENKLQLFLNEMSW